MHDTAGGMGPRQQPPDPNVARPHVQVRNAQLDKEASELRQENETLLWSVEEQKHSAVNSAQVREGPPPPCRGRCRRRRLCTTS